MSGIKGSEVIELNVHAILQISAKMPRQRDSCYERALEQWWTGNMDVNLIFLKFIIAFLCMTIQTMIDKANMSVVQAHNCSY